MLSKKRKLKKGKDKKDIFSYILIAIFLCSVAVFLVFSNIRINQRRKEMSEEVERLKQEVEILEQKNIELQEGLIQAESDVYWEARLYEQGYIKPGEEPIVILPPPVEEEEPDEIAEEKDFFQNMIDWLLRRN